MPPIDSKYPDLPTTKWYEYRFKEALPRLLDMLDRQKVKVTFHMVGAAVDLHPALAKRSSGAGTKPPITDKPQYSRREH
jgi:hypothetical protein